MRALRQCLKNVVDAGQWPNVLLPLRDIKLTLEIRNDIVVFKSGNSMLTVVSFTYFVEILALHYKNAHIGEEISCFTI